MKIMPEQKNQKITLIEDDHELARMIQAFLQSEGFEVSWTDNGLDGVDLILQEQPDLVVLDIMLPGIDGVEVCRRIRNNFTHPVLMLTAKDDDLSEVAALNTGADGYLNKPVRPHVLLAHINALLRRDPSDSPNLDEHTVQVQNLSINLRTYSIQKEGTDIVLTSGEFELLAILVKSKGLPVSRDDLYQQLRGIEYDGIDRSIDLRVSSLRKKLDDDVPPYRYIKTVRSKGYLLVL
jgi:DNA-binding response OmpR family regulator